MTMTPAENKALVERLEEPNAPGRLNIVDFDGTERLLDLIDEAATALRSFMDGGDVDYEVWQGDEWVASASREADARHYAAVYGQDGPVKLVRVVSYRTDLPTPPAVEGEAGE